VRGVEDDSVDFLRWAGVDEAEILKEYLGRKPNGGAFSRVLGK